jgi:hypothetical protein
MMHVKLSCEELELIRAGLALKILVETDVNVKLQIVALQQRLRERHV